MSLSDKPQVWFGIILKVTVKILEAPKDNKKTLYPSSLTHFGLVYFTQRGLTQLLIKVHGHRFGKTDTKLSPMQPWGNRLRRDTMAIYPRFPFNTEPQNTHPVIPTRPSWPWLKHGMLGTQSSSCHLPVECSMCAAVYVWGSLIGRLQLRLACREL